MAGDRAVAHASLPLKPHVVQQRQATDAVQVRVALTLQALAFAVRPSRILFL